jgi:hypothetical protein
MIAANTEASPAWQGARAAAEQWLYGLGLGGARQLPLPDFLGIGAQKAGTTWLHENLQCHPDLYLPADKELHFFDVRYHKSLSYYTAFFEAGRGKVKGEITPRYGTLPINRIRYIRAIAPNLRLILLIRNPIDRAWSQAVIDLVTRTKRKLKDVPELEFYNHFRSDGSMHRGDYRRIVGNWLRVFPRDQVYIGFFEDIARRPQQLLTEVFTHIGVAPPTDWSTYPCTQVIHKGQELTVPPRYRQFLRNLYAPEIEILRGWLGGPTAEWLDDAEGSTP